MFGGADQSSAEVLLPLHSKCLRAGRYLHQICYTRFRTMQSPGAACQLASSLVDVQGLQVTHLPNISGLAWDMGVKRSLL